MTSREQTLAIVLLGAITLIVGGAGGYSFVWQPLQQQQAAEEKLTAEIAELDAQLNAQAKKDKQFESARVRSLPAGDDLAHDDLARRAYPLALVHLAESAGIPKGFTVLPKNSDSGSFKIPEISKGKPVYTRIAYDVSFKHADMSMIRDFLEGYYRLGLLQQITSLHIKKEEDPLGKSTGKRNDLTVSLTTEAILIDGADKRRTLVPIPTAFGAVGGAAIFNGMKHYKGHDAKGLEFGLGITPVVTVPVLASNPRNYDLIVRKDPFNGPLPVVPTAPFEVARISDAKVRPNELPSPVKVSLSGEGSTGAKVDALVAEGGDLFATGALKVDPKTHAIELPETSAYEGSSTINVIATSAEGQVVKKSFKVSVEEPKKPKEGEDIAQFVVLIGVTQSDDGKVWARILDKANRIRYQIDADRKGIKVAKEWIWRKRGWEPTDDSKDLPPGVLLVSAPGSETHRTFKVIAVDTDGLIVADVHPDGKAPPKGGGKGPRPPAVKQHANPLAALGGNMIVAPAPALKYYRWGVGQSLAGLKLLKDDEAKKVLKQAEANAPVVDVAAAER